MRLLREKLPEIPLVAAFETGFHQSIPDRHRYYALPREWAEKFQVRRWGFHGASHRYIAERTAQLLGRNDLRIISCHLGGSSSLCAIRDGQSVATSMGMSPQTGIPQNNRVGDFDPFALAVLVERSGLPLAEILETLASKSGLAGLSDTSGDVRDLETAIAAGSARRNWPWTCTSARCGTFSGLPRRTGGRRCDRVHRRYRRERRRGAQRGMRGTCGARHRARSAGQRLGPRRSSHPGCQQPGASLGCSHERRDRRRPPSAATTTRLKLCSSPKSPAASSPRKRSTR